MWGELCQWNYWLHVFTPAEIEDYTNGVPQPVGPDLTELPGNTIANPVFLTNGGWDPIDSTGMSGQAQYAIVCTAPRTLNTPINNNFHVTVARGNVLNERSATTTPPGGWIQIFRYPHDDPLQHNATMTSVYQFPLAPHAGPLTLNLANFSTAIDFVPGDRIGLYFAWAHQVPQVRDFQVVLNTDPT
jgi:hypothetical protein